MTKSEVLKLFRSGSTIESISKKQLLDDKEQCEIRRRQREKQKEFIAKQRKLDKKFKFTGEKILIGRTSLFKSRKFVEQVIYDDWMAGVSYGK